MRIKNDKYFSVTIEKGLSILSLFDQDHPRLSLSEISRTLGINTTSTYRFVNTLVKLGYLKKNPNTKLLKLGCKALIMGNNFLHGFDLLQAAKPFIDKIFTEYRVTIDSALLDGLSLIALYRRESPGTIFFRQPLVNSALHARALGKAVLSNLNEKELLGFLDFGELEKFTDHTLTKREDLLVDIEKTKERGYSINNEEYMIGLIGIGASLMNFQTNTVVGAISFDFPASENSMASIEKRYPAILTKLANELSEIITLAEN